MTSAPDKEPDASGDGVQSENKTTNRWKMYAKLRTVLVGTPFVLLPAGLIGTGWGRIVDGIREIGEWNGGLYSFGFVVVVLGLGLLLFEPIEPNDKYGASGASTETAHPSRFSWIELVFVLFSLLSMAGGIRVLTVMHEEGKAQLAAGLFAAGGLALSVWATQRRSLEQQEREDKRQNDRLESESLREGRQLSVQQRMDMSKKLQTSIDHLSSGSEVVCAAAISELMFQIDDWNALIQGEITEIETRKPHDAERRVEEFKAEGLRRRQELFDLAMKDYAESSEDSQEPSSSDSANHNEKREFRKGIIAARRRGLKSAQKGSFEGVSFEGVRLPDIRDKEECEMGEEKDEVKKSLGSTYLRGVDLVGAHLEGANLREANLEGAGLLRAKLEGANLRGAKLEGANLRGAKLEGANLKGANLWGANLRGANLRGANLRGAKLEGANLKGVKLEGANLRGANLRGANLMDARLEGANLGGARLERANLVEARLAGADLVAARLEGADLWGARLEGAMLAFKGGDGTVTDPCSFDENTRWRGAFYSSSTVFPEGFDPQALGMILVDDPEPKEALEGGG
ncbi:pentapeptide repeat-containing protein [Corynebacterium sp. CCM 9204]|uniref:pentapeptide repeat-containing protein n=1 Tax=Corynebacterium sp. CCM 9204 TaxID=3057616 RepID=UPI0035258CAA